MGYRTLTKRGECKGTLLVVLVKPNIVREKFTVWKVNVWKVDARKIFYEKLSHKYFYILFNIGYACNAKVLNQNVHDIGGQEARQGRS